MNKVILLGRLTRDPEVSYGGENHIAYARYGIAVNRRYHRDGEPAADFFNCVSFGKAAEFVEKYLRKGTKILLEGELRNNNYTNQAGETVYSIQIVTNNIEFAESKKAAQGNQMSGTADADGFSTIPDDLDEELPFN